MVASAITIKVSCLAPKYVKGEYQFTKFQDFLRWLTQIRSLAKGEPGRLLYGLAKTGYLKLSSGHYAIDVVSSFYDYPIAVEIASKVGLLRPRVGGDSFSNKPELALRFTEELDKLLAQRN